MNDMVLHEGYFFQCSGNSGILIGAMEEGNTGTKDHGRRMLTDKCRLKLSGPPLQCGFLTAAAGGNPVLCQLTPTFWTGTSSKIKCNGHPALTTQSSMACGRCPGSVITPRLSVSTLGLKTAFAEIPAKPSGLMPEAVDFAGKESAPEKKVHKEQPKQDNCQGEDTFPYTMCDYENCQESRECPYFNSPVSVCNDSGQLRQNFKRQRSGEWEAYQTRHVKKTAESSFGRWWTAAHHIISGNNILMMQEDGELVFGHLVKLANYFGYDVNNAWNCILLPTNEKGYGEKAPIEKIADAYDTMWMMGRQWHSGPHNYPLSGDAIREILRQYSRQHPEQYQGPGGHVPCSDYVSVMREELIRVGDKYKRPRCWKKSYNRRREKFFEDMNCLSKKVEGYLLDFERSPKASYPFYVSKLALEYAFQLPSSVKIIVLFREEGTLKGKQVRVERYKKDKLQIIPKEKETMVLREDTDIRQWALFCQNAMYFLADETIEEEKKETYCFKTVEDPRGRPAVKEICLPQREAQKINIMEYLAGHGSGILAFIQQNERTYEPAARIVSIRLRGEKAQ